MRGLVVISVLAVLSTLCSAAPSASGDATVVSRSRETNSRRLQTPAEDHHDGHQQHNNLHADDSKISRIQPLRSYASTAFADLPSHFETTIHNNNKMHQQPRYHRNHINYHTAKLHETPNSAKQSRHHYGSSTDGGKKLTNQEVLRTLGLAKMNIPSSHHRKRLAVESRHHARPDDSHMYIIKLPPSQSYYAKNGPASGGQDRNAISDTSKKVSVDFKSNGKPGRIYHWNLPVLKKMLQQETGGRTSSNSRLNNDISELIDIRHIPTWSKPWENETSQKSYRTNDRNVLNPLDDGADDESGYKTRKSPSYYAPRPKKSAKPHHSDASSANAAAADHSSKHFPGNGKPQGFYVMKGKGHKPYYRKLIP